MKNEPNSQITIQVFIADFNSFIDKQEYDDAISQLMALCKKSHLMTQNDCQLVLDLMHPIFNHYLQKDNVSSVHEFCEKQLNQFSFKKLPLDFQATFYQKVGELLHCHKHDELALTYCYKSFYLVEPNQTKQQNDCLSLIKQIGLSAQSPLIHDLLLMQLKTFREKRLVLWQAKTQEGLAELHQLRKGYLPPLFKQGSFLGDMWAHLSLTSKTSDLYEDLKDEIADYLELFEGELSRTSTLTEFQAIIAKWIPTIDQFIRHQQYSHARTYCIKILSCCNKPFLDQYETHEIDKKISEINQLKLGNIQQKAIIINDKTDQDQLKQIRLNAQEQLENHEDFVTTQSSFNNAMITLLQSILDDVIDHLGQAPCSFAILGLGSISRHELSAYSDLDFALLIEDNKFQKDDYFQILVKLLKLQLDLLGESLEMGKPGLRLEQKDILDIQNYGCIGTVEDFLGAAGKYHPNNIRIDDIDAYAIHHPMMLFSHNGGEKLFSLYQNFLRTVFQHGATAIELNNQIPRYQQFGLDYLAEHARTMQFVKHYPTTINLKEPFTRFMSLWCIDISLYYNLDELNPDKILDQLNKKNIFSETFIKEFQSAYNFIRQLRFKHHLHQGCQEDEIEKQTLSKEERDRLTIIENTLLPASYKAISLMQGRDNKQQSIDPAIDLFEQKRLELLEDQEGTEDEQFKELIAQLINTLIIRKTTSAITYRDYYKKLTDHLESYRPYFIELIKQQKGHSFLDSEALEHIIQILNQYPYANGFRPAVEEEERQWQESVYYKLLRRCTTEQPDPERVYVKMPDGHLYYFPKSIENRLFYDDGNVKRSYPNLRRPVARLEFKLRGQAYNFHLKQYPELPGVEYTIDHLHELIIGHGTTKTILCGIKHPKQKSVYPALLSKTVQGNALSDWFKDNPNGIPLLDKKAFSQLVLLALLTNPEDGKANNYRVEEFVNDEGQTRYRIIGIDNDHALVPPLSKITKKDIQEGDAEKSEKNHIRLNIKCILFCFNEMKATVDKQAREEFLSLNPLEVIKKWHEEVSLIEKQYFNLFSPEEHTALLQNPNEDQRSCVLAMFYDKGISRFYNKFYKLQRILKENETIPHQTLLEQLQNKLVIYYGKELRDETKTPIDRWKITDKEYGGQRQHGTGQTQSTVNRFLCLAFGEKKPLIEKIRDKTALNLQRGLHILGNQQCTEKYVEKVKQELTSGKPEKFRGLLVSEFRAKVINQINFGELENIQQRNIIDEIKKHSFTYLQFRKCRSLQNKDLVVILNRSTQLKELDISDCELLTENILQHIANKNEQIERLALNNLARWKKITANKPCSNLKELYVRDNPNLLEMLIDAPNLIILKATGSDQIKNKTFIEKYPFLISLTKEEYTKFAELEITLDKVLIEHGLNNMALRVNNDEETIKVRKIIYELLTKLFENRRIITDRLKRELIKRNDVIEKANLLLILTKLGAALPEKKQLEVINRLRNALRYNDLDVRASAADALGELGNILPVENQLTVIDRLLNTLWNMDNGESNRRSITRALVKLGRTLPQENQFAIIDELRNALADDSYYIQTNATKALVKLGVSLPEDCRLRVIDALQNALKNGNQSVRALAARALGKLWNIIPEKSQLAVIENFRNALEVGENEVRESATKALGKLSKLLSTDGALMSMAFDELRLALSDNNLSVRENAIKALGKLGHIIPEKSHLAVLENLWNALRDEDLGIQASAAKALGKLGEIIPEESQWVVIDRLQNALEDSVDEVQESTAEALGKIEDLLPSQILGKISVELWKILQGRESWRVRVNAAEALGKLSEIIPEESRWVVIDRLQNALEDESKYVRSQAAIALGQIGGFLPLQKQWALIDALRKALWDKEDGVQVSAAKALGMLGDILPPQSQRVIDRVRNTLKDEDKYVRAHAAMVLGKLCSILPSQNRLAVIDVLRKAMADKEYDVRSAIVDVLVDLGEILPSASRLMAIDGAWNALEDENHNIQISTAIMLGKYGDILPTDSRIAMIDGLRNALEDRDNCVLREHAAEALVKLGAIIPEPSRQQEIETLVKTLEDSYNLVRQNAAKALGQLCDIPKIFPILFKQLFNDLQQADIHSFSSNNKDQTLLVSQNQNSFFGQSSFQPVKTTIKNSLGPKNKSLKI